VAEATLAARPDSLLITQQQSWTLAGLNRTAWHKLRRAGLTPDPVALGPARRQRWRRQDILDWVATLPSRTS